MLNSRDTAAVMFALRFLQANLDDCEEMYAERCEEEGTSPLTADELDELAQRINFSDPIVIAVDGGLVQSVNHPWACTDVVIIDYDTAGACEDEVTSVPQPDGEESDAFVSIIDVTPPAPEIHQFAAKYLRESEDTDD